MSTLMIIGTILTFASGIYLVAIGVSKLIAKEVRKEMAK
jgi:hypothetical protein